MGDDPAKKHNEDDHEMASEVGEPGNEAIQKG
jgi:hypothetical protein